MRRRSSSSTGPMSRNLVLTYSRDPDRINVMEGRFLNEDEGFQSDVLTWPSVDALAGRGAQGQSRPARALPRPRACNGPCNLSSTAAALKCCRWRWTAPRMPWSCKCMTCFALPIPCPAGAPPGASCPARRPRTLILDSPVTFEAGQSLSCLCALSDGPGGAAARHQSRAGARPRLSLATPLSFAPIPYDCVWACGESSPVDTAQRPFRVVRMARNADHSVHLQAIAHNPTLYDEPTAEPLPDITTLFNPLGPPPPITSLVLLEVTRVEPSGASLRVVNVSWDVAPLSPGTCALWRGHDSASDGARLSTTGGLGEAGTQTLGVRWRPGRATICALTQVSGHVLDFDDYTVVTGTTYDYRVIPVSQRGVPNNGGRPGRPHHGHRPDHPGLFPRHPAEPAPQGQDPLDPLL